MKKKRLQARFRRQILEQAGFRCGYCLTPQRITGARMVIDRILPEAAGGLTTEDNLWLACHACNEFKGAQTLARDPVTGRLVRLFNPCKQRWSEDRTHIIGLTSCGRATVVALQMNHKEIVCARQQWANVGW